MIEISSRAKTASRCCDKALALDYYEMLTRKSEVERDIREVLSLSCETTPAAKANLKCQFPNHEALLNKIKTCAKLVVRKYDDDDAPSQAYVLGFPVYKGVTKETHRGISAA